MSRPNLKQTAYVQIRDKIINCVYEPGAFMTEEVLCEELEMSRTPVRDALGRLEQESLIKILPKKGFLITPVSINEINMVFEGRMLLEPYIIQNYCRHMPEETLVNMQDILRAEKESINKKSGDLYDLDHDFHMSIINRCTNHYFLDVYKNIFIQNSRLRVMSGEYSDERLDDTVGEHMDILVALVKNDLDEAADHMRTHLRHSKESAFSSFLNQHEYI